MTISSNQPYYFPYIAYWQMIGASDLFLVGDDFAYMKHGWIARNRILVGGGPQYFRVEVDHKSSFRLISDTLLSPSMNVSDKLKTVEMAYHEAPYFGDVFPLFERVLCNPERRLVPFLEYSIKEVCDYLGITTPFGRTSDYPGNSALKREERIYDLCVRTGADRYINLPGGSALYHAEDFAKHGIELRFIRSRLTPYRQWGGPFVERLSILDAMMFNSREQLHAMLDDYDLVDG